MTRTNRSLNIHTVVARDYEREKQAERQEIKLGEVYTNIERRMKNRAKWRALAEKNSINRAENKKSSSCLTLNEFLERERLRTDQVAEAKKTMNGKIRNC